MVADKEQLKNEEKSKLDETILAFFMLILLNSKKLDPLFAAMKKNRNSIKSEVNNIYVKYSKDNIFKINTINLNKEMRLINNKLKSIGQDLYIKENKILKETLNKVYKESYYKILYELNKGMNIKDIKKLKDSEINKIIKEKIEGLDIFDRNKANKEKLLNKVKSNIVNNLKKGESIEKINKTIDKNFNEGAYVSKRLIETEIARSFNKANYEAMNIAGVEKVRFVAVLDGRTSEICLGYSDEVFNIEDAPIPPLHQFCRSSLVGIIDNINNQYTGSYEEWLEDNEIEV